MCTCAHIVHQHCKICFQFYIVELQAANKSYEDSLAAGNAPEQSMFSISRDIEELNHLNSECRIMHHELIHCLSSTCTDELFQELNIPKKLTSIKSALCDLIKRIAHFRRTPAAHVFVLMVNSGARDTKPYASPVQCTPYVGLKEKDVRRLVSDLCKEMVSL